MADSTASLTVLAPLSYYAGFDLEWLAHDLTAALAEISDVEMSFRFQSFPEGFGWPCDDAALRTALENRQAVWR